MVENNYDPQVSMTICDKQGNKLSSFKDGRQSTKINSKSNMFSKSGIKKDETNLQYGGVIEPNKQERVYNTAGQSKRAKTNNSILGFHGEQPRREEIASRGDESLGVESSYRFKGRGSDF